MVKIEACIQCESLPDMIASIRAAGAGGAATIELCREMSVDGLTPGREFILAARKYFDQPGLMVMIRPRAGDFCYRTSEILDMERHIDMAAECGADGVVYGLLGKEGQPALKPLTTLVQRSKKCNLRVTFHRAFDATKNPLQTLEDLIDLGVDRILTSGTPWGRGLGALDGLERIGELFEYAGNRIDIVIGGGVKPANAAQIIASLSAKRGRLSLHAYSGVQRNGLTDATLVRELFNMANGQGFPDSQVNPAC
jgi:copper homeostasis protein